MSTFLRLLWVFCLLAPTYVLAQDSTLRPRLENAYQQWRSAVTRQDAHAWAASITRYRQVVTRNLIVSQKQPFPSAVFAVPLDPPDISSLKLLEAQAVGDTAHLLYFGKVNMGGDADKIPDAVLMLKFFKEPAGWKFDSTKLLRLTEQPELATQIRNGGKLDFLDWPQFTPPGKTPAVPALCDVPDNVAGCTLQSYGYETRMVINGFDYPAMQDHAEKIFVIGGLKNGANNLTLEVKPTEVPAGEERLLQIDFFVLRGKGKDPVRVFHYETKEASVSSPLRLTIPVTADVLENGR